MALLRCAALLALTHSTAASQSLVAEDGSGRRLQRAGATQSNVCGTNHGQSIGSGSGGRGDRLTYTNGHSAFVGTIHDDATDEAIDCTAQGATCGQAGGNSGYSDNLDCQKIIVAPAGSTIELLFSSIALEQDYDFVTVYDGGDINAPVLGRFTGTDLPNRILSTGPEMTVQFTSDTGNYGLQQAGVDVDPGFYADWSFIDHLDVGGSGICAAPAIFTDPHGSIHDEETGHVNCGLANCGSGTGNAGYADNTACYTSIHAPAGEQVRLTFTQMNLEGPEPVPGCGTCPPGGCDWVEVFDGENSQAPSIGRFTGALSGAALPSVISSGTALYIEFMTDTRNCGITNTNEDPGWFADWDFVENGQNICAPDSAVLRAHHGVLRDDEVATSDFGGGNMGYRDNADCGVRIRGDAGSTINFHLVQMNLEANGDLPGGGGTACAAGGCDYLEVFDGRDANAPLLAHFTGRPTDQVLGGDTVTSTGRDMYLHFTSDEGNGLIGDTTSQPGFYGEWEVITDGQECENFRAIPGTAIIGHNSESISGTPEECMAACCARSWCKSFDYMQSTVDVHGNAMDAGANNMVCNLADVDATTSQGATTRNPYDTLYERPADTHGAQAGGAFPIGAAGCSAMLSRISTRVNNQCCPAGGCSNGAPTDCSEQCSAVWMPFAQQCSEFIKTNRFQNPELLAITDKCEREEYGRYKPNSNHGRCSDSDLATFYSEFAPACCGPTASYCPGLDAVNPTLVTPMMNGQPHCDAGCATFAEEFHSECHPRIDGTADEATLSAFLGVCQGITPQGGGHRRAEDDSEVAYEPIV
jgi:hypothetical protein